MEPYYSHLELPLNLWDKNSIRPGPVGSVGDCMSQVRLRQSAPDMTPRYINNGARSKYLGSSITDGRHANVYGGLAAKTVGRSFKIKPGDKRRHGWIKQDILPVDKTSMTQLQSLGQYSWKNKVASVVRARVTGEAFMPLPNGYGAAKLGRGSQTPVVVSKSSGTGVALPAATQAIQFDSSDSPYDYLLDQPHTFIPAGGAGIGREGVRPDRYVPWGLGGNRG